MSYKKGTYSLSVALVLLLCISLTSIGYSQTNNQSTKGTTVANGVTTVNVLQNVQDYFIKNAERLNLKVEDLHNWRVTDDYTSKDIRHIHIVQLINDLSIDGAYANIALSKEDEVLYVTNSFVSNIGSLTTQNLHPAISASNAIEKAATILGLSGSCGIELENTDNVNYKFSKGDLSREEVKVDLVVFNAGEKLVTAWTVSIYELKEAHWWQLTIDATTGEELKRVDWVTHCSTHTEGSKSLGSNVNQPLPLLPPPPTTDQYNVFALPVESPNHGSRSLEVGPYVSSASPFGWHDTDGVAGEEYTITRGNNVFAYEDANDDNQPGFSPDGGAALDFDFTLNINQNPSGYQDVAITNLFYTCNRIHDILYQYGFDAPSGNFQVNNYGNGGADQDEVFAEAQDGGGTNNANFATPPDGDNPRMQMYIWNSATTVSNYLDINSPAGIAGSYGAADATFGPGVPSTPITADIVLIIDDTAPVNDGCQTIVNSGALAGKIVLIDRGNCAFTAKVLAAQNEGALAVIVANDVAGAPTQMGGTDPSIVIPSIMISQSDGNAIKAQLSSGTVNATISDGGVSNFAFDGDFDNGIITHEYGHGVSTRLTGGPANSSCLNNSEQMGEGWSDYLSCVLTMDMSIPNPVYRPVGTYASGQPTNGIGIRPTAYDTSFAVNNYTYGSVADVTNISEPHGIGFIWATMLWDLNWAFIDQYGFDPNIETGTGGNNMVLQLVIEGLKLQPCSPGFVDGRDAILQADQLLFAGANQCLIWETFAKRGLGYSASQGSSSSRTDQTEAFDIPNSCQIPVSAPSANFDANTYITCNGDVQFEDLSTDIPQSWLWDFGDSGTSTLQNPFHTYTTSGLYTVTLTVTNSLGSDAFFVTNFIEVNLPDSPIVQDGNGCPLDSIMLSATGTDIIHWTDMSGNLLDTGNVFYSPASPTSTSYYAINVVEPIHSFVGPADTSIGTGGNHSTSFIGAINFTAETPLVIHSAWVYSGAAGTRQISLWDGYNTAGTPIQVIDVDVPFVGGGRIDLGFEVDVAGQYSFGLSSADLYRNDAGANYPYSIPGLISLDGSPANDPGFYYYFYDLDVSERPCRSDSVLVTANVQTVDFNTVINGFSVDFTDLSVGATSWSWDFGDGSTSTDENPTHVYAADGFYDVVLTINGNCSMIYTIAIGSASIDDLGSSPMSIAVYPNPASDLVTIRLKAALLKDAEVKLYSVDGKLLKELIMKEGESERTISLSSVLPQLTYLVFTTDNVEFRQKLIIK